MTDCLLQIGCMIILLYISLIYFRECRKYRRTFKDSYFDELLLIGILTVFFDGLSVIFSDKRIFPDGTLMNISNILYFICYDGVIFVLFLYMLHITGSFPKKRSVTIAFFIPFVMNVIVVLINVIHDWIILDISKESTMRIIIFNCFIMAVLYIAFTIGAFFRSWKYIESNKRISVFTYLLVLAIATTLQMILPDIIISSISVTLIILGIYMNQEDPALMELSRYHNETVISFANLIENRDDNTGGHVKRTSMYVKLIAEEMRARGLYANVLTKDYLENLLKAAPMHDIGKISVPDAILQKPGMLDDDEYLKMKLHAVKGGEIIEEAYKNLGNDEYRKMAYEVARYHHEKWNGKGYPEGLKGEEIPLCARIMAVADVFDAVSEKRCYRDAMSLEQSFDIIKQGSGVLFDPSIASTFLSIKDRVEQVHSEFAAEAEAEAEALKSQS